MRLKISRIAANERLTQLAADGYRILQAMQVAQQKGEFILSEHTALFETWGSDVLRALLDIFPTDLENHKFNNPDIRRSWYWESSALLFEQAKDRLKDHLSSLEKIRTEDIEYYTDLPVKEQLYVEDIDSFQKVRDVNPAMVSDLVKNGMLNGISENRVQLALERILNVTFHKEDWGGESNDLYTTNVIVSGDRRASAFL
jgi:hypothetical protein